MSQSRNELKKPQNNPNKMLDVWLSRYVHMLRQLTKGGSHRYRVLQVSQFAVDRASKCRRDLAGPSKLFFPVSHLLTFNWLYCYRQLTVSVSAIAVFRLVDSLMPGRLRIVHWPNYKLKPFANSNRDAGFTLVDHLPGRIQFRMYRPKQPWRLSWDMSLACNTLRKPLGRTFKMTLHMTSQQ